MKKKGFFSSQLPDPAITHIPSAINADKLHSLSDEEKIECIKEHFKGIMETLGLDLSNPSLSQTPNRVAKMYVKEIFSGLDPKNFPEMSFFENDFSDKSHSNIIFVKSNFTSFCEHHFVPMNGIAYVAYLPKKKIIGLSKIPRIINYFSNRPQLQERLSAQIADSLSILLETENVAVSIVANHYCMIARGVKDDSSQTITNVLRGEFSSNAALREEFFNGINRTV